MATNYVQKEPVRRAQRLAVQCSREREGRPPPDFSFANYSRPQPESILT